MLIVGCFRSFLARCRSFQVVSGCLLLVVGCFRSFQVVSCSLYVVSGRFRLSLARCRSFQVVSGRFRSFQVVPSFSKYGLNSGFDYFGNVF